jgi:hypothetical protein
MPEGLFMPTVMFFRLTNSLATFQMMMNMIFWKEVQEGWFSIFMDDGIIYTKWQPGETKNQHRQQHQELVHQIFDILEANNLYTRLLVLLPPPSLPFAMSLTPTPPSSLPNLDPQALSEAQYEHEVRAWFSALWDAMDTEESPIPAPISSMDTLQLWLQDEPGLVLLWLELVIFEKC